MLYLPFTRIWVSIVFYFIILEGKLFFQQRKWRFFAVLSIDNRLFMIFLDNLITHERDLSLGLQSTSDIHTSAFIFRHLAGGMVPSSGWRDSLWRYQHRHWGGFGGGRPADVASLLSDGGGLRGRGPDDPLHRERGGGGGGRAAGGGRGCGAAARATVCRAVGWG